MWCSENRIKENRTNDPSKMLPAVWALVCCSLFLLHRNSYRSNAPSVCARGGWWWWCWKGGKGGGGEGILIFDLMSKVDLIKGF